MQILIVLRFHAKNQICFQMMIKYYNIFREETIYLASRANAIIPAANGAAADVPV